MYGIAIWLCPFLLNCAVAYSQTELVNRPSAGRQQHDDNDDDDDDDDNDDVDYDNQSALRFCPFLFNSSEW